MQYEDPESGEKWLEVPGRSMYLISDHGRVFSRHGLGCVLKQSLSGRGYLTVSLGYRRTYFIHRLVAKCFLGPRPSGQVVNHRDGVKTNNHVSNLEYTTYAGNSQHAYRLGLQAPLRGTDVPGHKLTERQVREIRELSGYLTQKEIGLMYGVCQPVVCGIISGARWSHVS